MTDKKDKEKKEEGNSGSFKDNSLSKVKKIMKDNNLPTFYSEEDDDTEDKDD